MAHSIRKWLTGWSIWASCTERSDGSTKPQALYQRALPIRQAQGHDHPESIRLTNNIGYLEFQRGNYDRAEQLLRQSVAGFQRILGPNHSDVGSSLKSLADMHAELGKYDQAEPEYKGVMEIWEKALGVNHQYIAVTLQDMANMYFRQKKYDPIEPMLLRALDITQKSLGPDRAEMVAPLKAMGDLKRALGKNDDAKPFYQRGITIRENLLAATPNDRKALNDLAWIQATCPDEQFRDAKKAFENANKAYQVDGGRRCSDYNTLAAAYAASQAYPQAKEWAVKAISQAKGQKAKRLIGERAKLYEQNQPFRDDGLELQAQNPL